MPAARRTLSIEGRAFEIVRNEHGVPCLWAEDDIGLAGALGYAHARDRLVQMELIRLVGQGRLTECLADDDDALTVDVFMRQMGMQRGAERDVEGLSSEARRFVEAYAAGVNHVLSRSRRPLELWLVGHRPEPWTVADSLLTLRVMSYVGLAQGQQDIEKLLIQALRDGVPIARLAKLFDPHLEGFDPSLLPALQDLRHFDAFLPRALRFLPAVPSRLASNNWAVAGTRTASGSPLQCNDPHLECNRLPPVWAEMVMHTGDDYRLGVTLPGVPGLVMGRTRQLSFGFTYGFMDMIDHFVEECRDGRVRRGDDWHPLDVRSETIRRKKRGPLTITVRESDHGVLEADPSTATLEDGFYLARAYSGHRFSCSPSIEALCRVGRAPTVAEAQALLRDVTISCNWVIADRAGDIGYQQSGLLPERAHSGLFPVAGWDARLAWKGRVPGERLHALRNPENGYVATANDELNPRRGPLVVNLPMGSYRVERIGALLAERHDHTPATMQAIQRDLYSLQAERFLGRWGPWLPGTKKAELLRSWDRRYDVDSRGATLFEELYERLLRRVFGEGFLGAEPWDVLANETAILAFYYHLFDRILLGDDPSWFGEAGPEPVVREILAEVLDDGDPDAVPGWGSRRRVLMTNVFFLGKLPRWLGFDFGPIELPGNRATVVQSGVFDLHGRRTTFFPSWRFVSDLAGDEAWTALAGGPSGRRFSRWYTSGVRGWLAGEYRVLRP